MLIRSDDTFRLLIQLILDPFKYKPISQWKLMVLKKTNYYEDYIETPPFRYP